MNCILTDNIEDVPIFTNNKVYRYGDIIYQLADYRKCVDTILTTDRYNDSILYNTLNDLKQLDYEFLTREFNSCAKNRALDAGITDTIKYHLRVNINKFINQHELQKSEMGNFALVNMRVGDVPLNCSLDDNTIIDDIISVVKTRPGISIVYMFVYNYDGRALDVFKRSDIQSRFKIINNILQDNSMDHDYRYTHNIQNSQTAHVRALIEKVYNETKLPYKFLTTGDENKVYNENVEFTDFQVALSCLPENEFIYNKAYSSAPSGFSLICDEMRRLLTL